MADVEDFAGTWKIVKCSAVPFAYEPTGIEGAEFTLDESGDVSWNIPENTVQMPFFNCETYEIYSSDPYYLRFFGTFVGHVMEFQVDRLRDDYIQLTYEGWCVLQCERVLTTNSKEGQSIPYSFLCALTEGFLSDLSIHADNGTEFKVHKTILGLANPEIDWNSVPSPLSDLPEEVLFTVLHYLYAECLPSPLKDETARNCLLATADIPGFEDFKKLCQLYLKNNALLDQILNLVEEIHAIGDLIIDYFNGQTGAISSSSSSSESESEVNFANNPSKLRYVIIQALRESAVVGAKVLVLCNVFSNRKNELCSAERHELIEYLKSRLPDFMKQLYKFLDVIKLCLGSLSPLERMDIAAYFVSDIERALDVVFEFATDIKRALERIIHTSSLKKEKNTQGERLKENVGQALGRSLKNALHMRELMKLRSFHERVLASFMNLMHKKEIFSNMNSVNKNRSVSKNLEQFIEELPMFMLRTKELTAALEEKLTFKEWKYWFKLGTSKVAWVLSRLSCHRDILDPIISRIDSLVNRDSFSQSLVQLGLLDALSSSSESSSSHIASHHQPECREVKSFHESPPASESKLALNAVSILKKGLNTDMSFEIIFNFDSERQDSREIKAHCIVIASRCDWFKKALLSGMKESIDKKIIVHDTTPELFMIFLEYVYGGQVDTGQLNTEQLADLMQLSDRYEVDCLKQISEEALKNLVDEDSALFLLGIADQFNARSLRTATLEFIAMHKDLAKSEVFYDLPDELQSEVEEMITWVDLRNSQRSEDGPQLFNADSPSSMSSSLLDIEELFSANNLSANEEGGASDSSSLEELTHDSALLEACVAQLRDIVGESVPREELVRVGLAADYDVNRALNFYFSRFS
ncbi:uncharacterized protein [Parasteatoda tepidariorum]|nr:uncharacterized protein LOC107452391 [Parasteatoda tepidariorum]